jgi:hypothetical protein
MNSLTANSARLFLFFIAVVFLFSACREKDNFDSLDLLEKINSLEGVSAVEITPSNNYVRAFQIDVTQPVDHKNPNGAKFTQRVYLSNADEKTPMVFAPSGYGTSATSLQEIARVLQTNCMNVTHRYFPGARPEPLDWKYLTIEQAAADHHRIVQLFKKIYKGKWISSGASKSGLTPLFHKRYYPNDVDATIAYVAPFTFGPKDTRFPIYLTNLGGSECFNKLKAVQIFVLNHRQEMLDFMDNYIKSSTGTYSMERELLLELDIMDYPFTYWQYYYSDCSFVPDTSASTALQIFQHYSSIVPPVNFSDENISYYAPYAYQAMSELGAPAYQTDYLEGYLKKVDPNASGNPNYELVGPKNISYTFNYNTLPDIYDWLQNNGDHIIYIYGKNDPWSAGAIELSGTADALLFMQEGTNHGSRISTLDHPDEVYTALEKWLGITIPAAARKSFTMGDEKPGFRLVGGRE